ncbi:MAG: serine hydrolase [Planctomycetota bacterium]|nr:serine hydrolase [Planctomycetota bacterium]
MSRLIAWSCVLVVLLAALSQGAMAQSRPMTMPAASAPAVFPSRAWEKRTPQVLGLSPEKLDALRDVVGGRGCVVRHGYMAYQWGDQRKSADVASAMKPVISTLMLMAVQDKKIGGVDEKISRFEPRLREINGGKDAEITWRHLASQTSGYGLVERPGEAYSYNDFALALYYDTLMNRVYQQSGTAVLKARLGGPLEFEDNYTFEAFGSEDRPGRLAISVRDFARFGLLYLRGGRWRDRQVIDAELLRMAISSPISADTPLTSGKETAMLLGQRSIGGTRNITPVGPGYYRFNWWLNRTDKAGRRLFVDAPPDTYVASGHGGPRMLWIIPSLDLVVSWNDAKVEDHDASPGNANSACNQAARLIREAVIDARAVNPKPQTRILIRDGRWQINGSITYPGAGAQGLLMNVRMVNAVFEDRSRPDFDAEANTDRFIASIPSYVEHGVRAFTLCLQGGFPGYEGAVNSAFNPDGSLRESDMRRVRRAIEACDKQGAAVILGCYYQRQDQILRDDQAVQAGLVNVMRWIRECGFTNVVVEVANEYGHGGFDRPILRSSQGIAELIRAGKEAAPDVLISASGAGGGELDREVTRGSDFFLIHFNNTPIRDMPARIAALKSWNKPIVCNEDAKTGREGALAAEMCVRHGASWGLMVENRNQHFPFTFGGASDDLEVYAKLKELTSPRGR